MTLAPLVNASPVIQAHAYLAFLALGLGAAQFALPKGVALHRAIGWAWALAMIGVAGVSFFIHTMRTWGPWSPIHLLSLPTLAMVPVAVSFARNDASRAIARRCPGSFCWRWRALAFSRSGRDASCTLSCSDGGSRDPIPPRFARRRQ